jgi:hypothetical protein
MKFVKRLYRRLAKLNLWLHAGLALAGVLVLFAIPAFPGSSSGFKWLSEVGLVLIFGIGDGYPSMGMKIAGGVVLAFLALATLCTLVLNISFFGRLLFERTTGWRLRAWLFVGVASILAISFFNEWVSNCDEFATDAILKGNIESYERAARWRRKGDLNDDLFFAARVGQLKMVEYLIAKGANPNAKFGGNRDSVLAGAIPNVMNRADSNTPVIEYLKRHGATN